MPTFEASARELARTRREAERARREAHEARERLAQLERRRLGVDRSLDPRSRTDRAARDELTAEWESQRLTVEETEERLTNAAAAERLVAERFRPFSDPRQHVASKDAGYPFLLLPVRLETRFKRVERDGAMTDELWVRVYPDDCMVDTFEATPSESEVASARSFWVNWARAGGDRNGQRGAWRGLVAGFGSGRAAWLLDRYRPPDPEALPVKAVPKDVILVVTPETPVPAAERATIAAYWGRVWQAEGDAAEVADADHDLEAALGAARASHVRDRLRPVNMDDRPPPPDAPGDVAAQVAFLDLPDEASLATQRQSWSQAPRVFVLPERLVLLGYRNGKKVVEEVGNPIPATVIAGPDPSAPPADQLRPDGDDVSVGSPMRWITDFDEAVRIGMGFRVPLAADDVRQGFDRMLVLGVKLSADHEDGKELLETLLTHHQTGSAGFSIVPQGTPTNNTESRDSGFSETEDADDSFDLVLGQTPPLAATPEYLTRRDGQWLADCLGVDLSTFDRTPHSRGTDQSEARAMNTALWPATWGYLLETMLKPVLDTATIETTRWFFTNFVTGRGLAPAVRIGDQPYGILPATTLSRMAWLDDDVFRPPAGLEHPKGFRAYLPKLDRLLRVVRERWERIAPEVAFVGKPGDQHQHLLDILGLMPSSVEFEQRYAESIEEISNRLTLQGYNSEALAMMWAGGYLTAGLRILETLGYDGDDIPELLEKFFMQRGDKLTGPLIDDVPPSEVNPVRAYTPDGRNYLTWLRETARASFDALRRQAGFVDDKPPTALLYLFLRHALELGYWDSSLRFLELADALAPEERDWARVEPSFVHVADRPAPGGVVTQPSPVKTSGKPLRLDRRSESRYEYLYRTEPAVTGHPDTPMAQFVTARLGLDPATTGLDRQLAALAQLENAPTARLERVFAEHMDLCSYRLDAWRWGLVHYQLASLRYAAQDGAPAGKAKPGIYLGVFGWLEEVRSENKVLTPVVLKPDAAAVFQRHGDAPLMRESTNGGFIHAPSINHAITAAVLRNGYVANATPEAPELLSVNLSSSRVRLALGIIEGIRNGQPLGALLGYQLERGLHDRHAQVEVDRFIYQLRRAFPLVADHITDTAEPTAPIDAIEARNVVDGLALVDHIERTGQTSYPFGKPLASATAAERAAIDEEVGRIRDVHDAVADLAVAEGVYQAVQGNYGRTGATLEAYAKGTFPPEPEVIQTPRKGTNLTHRVAIHFEAGLDPNASPNAVAVTPRSRTEPAVNAWLSGLLPDPALVVGRARWFDPATQTVTEVEVSQAALGLQPLDLLYLVHTESEQAMADLDDRVVHWVMTTRGPRPDVDIRIDYTSPVTGKYSFFEVGALVRALRGLVLRSRPLAATDLFLANEATTDAERDVHVDGARITGPLATLSAVRQAAAADDLTDLAAEMAALLGDVQANEAQIVAGVDGWLDRFQGFAARAGHFGLSQAALGPGYEWRRRQFNRLLQLLEARVDDWASRLGEVDVMLSGLGALPSDAERMAALRRAERLVSTTYTVPEPADPAAYEAAVRARQGLLDGKRLVLAGLLQTNKTSVAAFLGDIAGTLPLDAYDLEPLDVGSVRKELVRFAQELAGRVDALAAEIQKRSGRTQGFIDLANASADAVAQATALVDAAKALFGEDFRLVPEFALAAPQANEIDKAFADRDILLGYLTSAPPAGAGRDFPVDDWLYGVARVREKLTLWESATMLAEAFGTTAPQIRPLQLPYRADDRWLALPFPDTTDLIGDRLLYSAHFTVPFDKAHPQCGLLVDEWTEVIPSREETTGVAFHYDRPNHEPAQTMLLALSPTMHGGWAWQDLVDTLHETLEEARLRAVEPAQIERTSYGVLLPGVITAVTRHPITIALNLALNNQVMTLLEAEDA